MRVFVYGFFLDISADRHEETHSKDVKKKKNNGSRLLALPCVTESEPPAMVNSGFLDHKPAAAAEHQRTEPSPLWSDRIRISANESQV